MSSRPSLSLGRLVAWPRCCSAFLYLTHRRLTLLSLDSVVALPCRRSVLSLLRHGVAVPSCHRPSLSILGLSTYLHVAPLSCRDTTCRRPSCLCPIMSSLHHVVFLLCLSLSIPSCLHFIASRPCHMFSCPGLACLPLLGFMMLLLPHLCSAVTHAMFDILTFFQGICRGDWDPGPPVGAYSLVS